MTDTWALSGRRAVATLICGALLAAVPGVTGCAEGGTISTIISQQQGSTTTAPVSKSASDPGSAAEGQLATPSTHVAPSTLDGASAAGGGSLWGDTVLCEAADLGFSAEMTLGRPVDVPDAEMGMSDPEMNRLVALPVTILNTGEEPLAVVLDWFELRGSDGAVYSPAALTDSPVALLQTGSVAPSRGTEGFVVFEVPEGVDIRSGACDVSLGSDPRSRAEWAG